MWDFAQMFAIVAGLVSAITAIVSVIFAWRAIKSTEHNNAAGLIVQLHSLYHTEKVFQATQKCWDMYNPYQETAGNIPLSHQKATEFINTINKDSAEWKAVHDLSSFWRYVALLERKGYLDQEIAFSAFSTPEILGFLFPIEKAFVKNYVYERSLEKLYDRWKEFEKQSRSKTKAG